MYRLWKLIGVVAYWVLLPLIYVYTYVSKPRARLLIIYGHEVLLIKNWLGAGSWALPGGGLERDESSAEAACREAEEELGLNLKVNELTDLGIFASRGKNGLKTKYYLHAIHLAKRPKITPRRYEITGYSWQQIDQAMAAKEGVSQIVKDSLAVWLRH